MDWMNKLSDEEMRKFMVAALTTVATVLAPFFVAYVGFALGMGVGVAGEYREVYKFFTDLALLAVLPCAIFGLIATWVSFRDRASWTAMMASAALCMTGPILSLVSMFIFSL